MNDAWRPALSRSVVLRHDHVRDADLLLLPERAVRLNATGAAILRLCDGRRTVADIVLALQETYGRAGLAEDVGSFLDRVTAQGWVR